MAKFGFLNLARLNLAESNRLEVKPQWSNLAMEAPSAAGKAPSVTITGSGRGRTSGSLSHLYSNKATLNSKKKINQKGKGKKGRQKGSKGFREGDLVTLGQMIKARETALLTEEEWESFAPEWNEKTHNYKTGEQLKEKWRKMVHAKPPTGSSKPPESIRLAKEVARAQEKARGSEEISDEVKNSDFFPIEEEQQCSNSPDVTVSPLDVEEAGGDTFSTSSSSSSSSTSSSGSSISSSSNSVSSDTSPPKVSKKKKKFLLLQNSLIKNELV